MKSYQNMFFYQHSQHSKLSCYVLLLLVTSSLFACSQENINTEEVKPVSSNPPATTTTQQTQQIAPNVVSQVAADIAQETAHISSSAVPVDILKTVSVTVYKDANCGCCSKWVEYAKKAGMQATVQHPNDLSLFKERYGVPQQMRSCHTSVTEDGYVFEGHIPTKYIAQFLQNPPEQAIGLAVPSMPVGSPGMEYQDKFLPYQVMQINKDGSTEVYATIDSPQQQL